VTSKEQSPGSKASDKKSQHKQPEIELDQNEYDTLMAAESIQRFMDGHQPTLPPAHEFALQWKVGKTAVQSLIKQHQTKQTGLGDKGDINLVGLVPDVMVPGDFTPDVERQGGAGRGGAGGMGGASQEEGMLSGSSEGRAGGMGGAGGSGGASQEEGM
jgi:hypothetical protein